MPDQFQYIKMPDGSYGKFSADASDADIRAAVQRDFPDAFKQQPQQEGFISSALHGVGLPASMEEARGMVSDPSGKAPADAAEGVYNVAANIGRSVARGARSFTQNTGEAIQNVREGGPILANVGKALSGFTDMLSSVNPTIAAGGQAGQQVSEGNYPGAAGSFTGGMISGALQGAGMEKPTTLVRGRATEAASDLFTRKPPQAAVYPEAAQLPPQAVSGAERIFRAAAPVGSDPEFRSNLYAAAGDLAEIGDKVEARLPQAAGGIREGSPDMRVKATVDAMNEHLRQMNETERAPQIARNASVEIPMDISEQSEVGLRYMSEHAGQLDDANLATRMLNSDTVSLSDLDRMNKAVNQELAPLRGSTPEQLAASDTTSRKLASLSDLHQEIKQKIADTLQQRGEPGVESFNRRYAGLSQVRDQLQSRMNMTELQRRSPLDAVPGVRQALDLVRSRGSSIAGASQAATANVNIGRELQQGFGELKASGLRAQRDLHPAERLTMARKMVQASGGKMGLTRAIAIVQSQMAGGRQR